MVFTLVECNDPRSMQAFIAELEDINIYAIDSDPQENYDCFIALLNGTKNKLLPRKECDLIKINTINLNG